MDGAAELPIHHSSGRRGHKSVRTISGPAAQERCGLRNKNNAEVLVRQRAAVRSSLKSPRDHLQACRVVKHGDQTIGAFEKLTGHCEDVERHAYKCQTIAEGLDIGDY